MKRWQSSIVSPVYRRHAHLIVKVRYGSGFRGIAAVRLRVNDVDFKLSPIMVRDGMGRKDRRNILPDEIKSSRHDHLR